MKVKIILPVVLGCAFVFGGPLLSRAEAKDNHKHRHHDRHRNHYYHPYYHGPSTGFVFQFNTQPAPVYRVPSPYGYSRNVVVDVQRSLNRRGYEAGPVDGLMGSRTRTAICEYQSDRGLRVTGTINEPLLRSLGL